MAVCIELDEYNLEWIIFYWGDIQWNKGDYK